MKNFFLITIQKRWILAALFVLLAFFGYYSWQQLSIEAYPDIADVTSQVVTQVPGLAAEEVEQQITIPLERALNGLPGMHVMRSKSTFGLSMITIVFEDGIEDYWSRQRVQERINEVDLPFDAVAELDPLTSPTGEIYRYLIESNQHSLRELTDLQNWVVIPRIKEVPGVADVSNFGGITTQYQIEVDPQKLEQYHLSLDEVIEAVENNNSNVGGSVLTRGDLGYVVRGIGQISSLEDLGKIVVSSEKGVPIFLNDLGKIIYGNLERKGVFGYSDRTREYTESIQGIVLLLKHENPSKVLAGIHEAVNELNNEILPDGVYIHTFLDRTELVDTTLHTVSRTLLEGMALVIIVLIIFLGNWRGALLVAITIPLSLLIAFILMHLTNVPANLLSLGAIDFGIIVDGAIVMMETILKKREDHPLEELTESSIVKRVTQVAKPIIFATIIIITAYLPLFAFERVERKLFTPMAFTVSYALIGALLVAIFLIPGIGYALYRKPRKIYHNKWLEKLSEQYGKIIHTIVRKPKAVYVSLAFILVAALGLTYTVGKDFLPNLDEGSIWLQVNLPPGISVEKSRELSDTLRQRTMKYPEVTYVAVQAGRNDDGTDPFTPSHYEVSVGIKPYKEWPRRKTKDDLIEELATEYAALPGFTVGFSQPMIDGVMDKISGAHSELVVKVFGNDFKETRRIAEEIVTVLENVKGSADLDIDQEPPLPQLQIHMNRDAIARYGLNVADVNNLIEVAIGGKAISQIYQADRVYDITCKFKEEARDTPEKIAGLMLTTAMGTKIPLSQVADIMLSTGESTITREMNKRHLTVKLNLRGRDLGSFLKEAQASIENNITYDHHSYRIAWGGQFENQHRAYSRLGVIVPLALAIMFVLLYGAFGKFSQAGLVLMIVPLALFGGMLALNVRGMTLNVSSAVGFIALFGVAIQNGVIMVSHINDLRKEGFGLFDAVTRGARHRFRPVLMTATVAILGLLPASLATGIGSDVQRPLATVIVYGLMFSTIITLFALPVFYYLIESRNLKINKGVATSIMIAALSFMSLDAKAAPADTLAIPSLTYDIYLHEVGKNNLDYIAERFNIRIAEAEIIAARILPDPEVEFEAGEDYYSVEFSYELELGGKRKARVRLARSEAELEKLTVEYFFQELRAEAADAYLEALKEREILRFKLSSYQYMHQLSISDSIRYKLGEITENDARQSRLEAASLQNEVYEQEAAYQTALVILNQYRGMNAVTLPELSGSLETPFMDFQLEYLMTLALDNRSDLMAALKNSEVAQNQLKLAKAERKIDVRLMAGYERDWHGLFPKRDMLKGGFTVPLPFSNTNKGAIRSARYAIEKSKVEQNSVELQIQAEVAQAYYNYEAMKKQVAQYQSSLLEEAQKLLDGIVYKYQRGETDILEVLIAQRTYNEIQEQYLETLKNFASALVELEKSCGTFHLTMAKI